MPLSYVQKGVIGENEATKVAMVTSDGAVEVDVPQTDDDRRDRELHERGRFGLSIAIQIKTMFYLHKPAGNQRAQLHIQFTVKGDRLVSHPLFWYLLAYFDRETMTFRDPMFLVDSATLHKHAWKKVVGKSIHLEFEASLSPESHDIWAPYQVMKKNLGTRLLEIIREAEQNATANPVPKALWSMPGSLRLRRSRRRPRLTRRTAA